MNTTGSSEMVSILTDHPVVNPEYYLRNSAPARYLADLRHHRRRLCHRLVLQRALQGDD